LALYAAQVSSALAVVLTLDILSVGVADGHSDFYGKRVG
jgi:hypothetical protein